MRITVAETFRGKAFSVIVEGIEREARDGSKYTVDESIVVNSWLDKSYSKDDIKNMIKVIYNNNLLKK